MRRSLLLFLVPVSPVWSQQTLFQATFDPPAGLFALNTNDVGSSSGGDNTWVINGSYTGGNGTLVCLGSPFTFTVPSTPGQPAGISTPNGNYLHIASNAALGSGITCASFAAADGFCIAPGNHFARMSSDVSTLGLTDVSLSFWWLCNGGAQNYGEVYYSIDGGTTWSLIGTAPGQYRNQPTWTQQTLNLPLFAGQSSLRFGFRFVNGTSLAGGQDPPFAIDDVRITGMTGVNDVQVGTVPPGLCAGTTVFVNYTATGAFLAGNIFTAQLSDATGSFASPVTIGSVAATTSGSLGCLIPAGTPAGTGYRIRVVSSNPAVMGNDNGSDITIQPAPNAGVNTSLIICSNVAPFNLYSALNGNPDPGGSWYDPVGNPFGGQFVPGTMLPGCFSYVVPGNGVCPNDTAQICVFVTNAPNAGVSFTGYACSTAPAVQLLSLLGGTPSLGGTWTSPGGAAHGPLWIDGVDPQGCYSYTVQGVPPCPNASAVVCILGIQPDADAGEDSSVVVCATNMAYDLIDALAGSPQSGGAWTDLDNTGALTGGTLNATLLLPGSYAFQYDVQGQAPCADTAVVTVTVDPCMHVAGSASGADAVKWLGPVGQGTDRFLVPAGAVVKGIAVLDLHGRTMAPTWRSSAEGTVDVTFNGSEGVYLVRMDLGGVQALVRLVRNR